MYAKGGIRRRDGGAGTVRLRQCGSHDLRAVCLVRAIADDVNDDLDDNLSDG